MEKIFFTVAEPVDEKHLETFRRIAKDLKFEYKCDVIVRKVNGMVLHTEVYSNEKEEEGCELEQRQIRLDV